MSLQDAHCTGEVAAAQPKPLGCDSFPSPWPPAIQKLSVLGWVSWLPASFCSNLSDALRLPHPATSCCLGPGCVLGEVGDGWWALGAAQPCMALARHGTAWHGIAQHGMAQHSCYWCGLRGCWTGGPGSVPAHWGESCGCASGAYSRAFAQVAGGAG